MEKIEHLVILMMENRSFDHYLGALSWDERYRFRDTVEGFPKDRTKTFSNPDESGEQILMEPLTEFIGYMDPPHGPVPQGLNYHGGKMDGFVTNYQEELRKQQALERDPVKRQRLDPFGPARKTPMGYYDRDTLPVLYALADQFQVCDHWFSSMLSSTWPNRKYLHSGVRDDDDDTHGLPKWPGFKTKPMWDVLEDTLDANGNRYTWKSYYADLPFLAAWYEFAAFHAVKHFASISEFVRDCREDTLPTVSIVDPPFGLADDHPSHDVRLGQKYIGLLVDALTTSESWEKTALVITYDENGGFFDHVPPPEAFGTNQIDDRLGFRVPTVVISPYTPAGICKTTFDHTSIMKSISMRWNIPFDTADFGNRYVNAPDIWSHCFNFSMQPRPRKIYTETEDNVAPFKNLNWEAGVHELIGSGQGDLENLLERIFVLPMLKILDRRHSLYDDLNDFETKIVNMKRPYK